MASSEQTKFKPSKIKTRQTYESVEQALGEQRFNNPGSNNLHLGETGDF